MDFNYLFSSLISIAAMLLLFYMVSLNNALSRRVKLFFRLAAIVIAVIVTSEIGTVLWEKADPSYRTLHILANMIGFGLTPILPMLIGFALSPGRVRRLFLCWIPAAVNLIFALLSPWFNLIFSVDALNQYSRGSWFFVFVIAYVAGMLFQLWETLSVSKINQNQNRIALSLLFLFVLLGTAIQVFAPQYRITWLCVSFGVVLYYAHYCEMSQQLDVLTSLLNRRAYETKLNQVDGSQNTTILYFDVDNFKNINDDYGHSYGDFCLETTAACILAAFSKIGLCYRIGGDEFCVISRHTNKEPILAAKQDFLRRINRARHQDPRLPMVSVGSGIYLRGIGSVRDAARSADLQMYHFKEQRKTKDPDQCMMDMSTEPSQEK